MCNFARATTWFPVTDGSIAAVHRHASNFPPPIHVIPGSMLAAMENLGSLGTLQSMPYAFFVFNDDIALHVNMPTPKTYNVPFI